MDKDLDKTCSEDETVLNKHKKIEVAAQRTALMKLKSLKNYTKYMVIINLFEHHYRKTFEKFQFALRVKEKQVF